MKKIVISTLAILLSAPAFAEGWGIALQLGAAQNNPKGMKEIYDAAFELGWSEKELTESNIFGGVEALYEWDLNKESNKLGIRIGIEGYGQNKLKLDGGEGKATEDTYAYPVTLYYKRDNGVKKWSWIAGVGITIMSSKFKFKNMGVTTMEESGAKVSPHIIMGGEYRFSKLFALGLEAKYNMAAKIKKDDGIISNRSGIGATLTGRFYF